MEKRYNVSTKVTSDGADSLRKAIGYCAPFDTVKFPYESTTDSINLLREPTEEFLKVAESSTGSVDKPIEYFNTSVNYNNDSFNVRFNQTRLQDEIQTLTDNSITNERSLNNFYDFINSSGSPVDQLAFTNGVISDQFHKTYFFDYETSKKINNYNKKSHIKKSYVQIKIDLSRVIIKDSFFDFLQKDEKYSQIVFRNYLFSFYKDGGSTDTEIFSNIKLERSRFPSCIYEKKLFDAYAINVNDPNYAIFKTSYTNFSIALSTSYTLSELPTKSNKIHQDKNVVLANDSTDFIPVYLKIEKYKNNQKTVLQEFYISIGPDVKQFSFIDSQVFSGGLYSYKFKIIGISKGINYYYTKDGNNYKINYAPDQHKLIEVPFAEKQAYVDTIAPRKPAISPTLMPRLDNNVVIPLTSSRAKEANLIPNNGFTTNKIAVGQSINFIDDFDSFLLYRIENEPTSVLDFINLTPIATISSKLNLYMDTIEYNKTYYYTVISKNMSFYSNPSEIFKIRLAYDKGAFIPQFEKIVLREKPPEEVSDKSKKMKKYLKISPSVYQYIVNEAGGIGDTYQYSDINVKSVGTNGASIWQNDIEDPKFKVRLTSRTTGKKIDINLNFKYRIINKFEQNN